MTDIEILEGNNLIAGFMQEPYIERGRIGCIQNTAVCESNPEGLVYELMKYHSSWDWLMPVVEKIERIWIGGSKTKMKIESPNRVQIWHEVGYKNIDFAINYGYDNEKTTRLENIWLAVVDFIKWYNSIQK